MNQQTFNRLLQTNIITELNLEILPAKEKVDLINKMAELIEKRVVVRILEGLTEDDLKTYEKLAKQPDGKLKFLSQRVPNFIELLQEETVKVKEELLNEVLSDKNLI